MGGAQVGWGAQTSLMSSRIPNEVVRQAAVVSHLKKAAGRRKGNGTATSRGGIFGRFRARGARKSESLSGCRIPFERARRGLARGPRQWWPRSTTARHESKEMSVSYQPSARRHLTWFFFYSFFVIKKEPRFARFFPFNFSLHSAALAE